MPEARTVRAWAGLGVVSVAGLIGVTLVAFPDGVSRVAEPPLSAPSMAVHAPPRSEGAVSALLRHRAEAIRERDESAFMTSIDPQAPAEFRRDQRALFRNLAELPLAAWSYEVDSSDTATPPWPGSWAPRVQLNYALEEVDAVPTRQPLRYVFTRRGGSWYLTDDLGSSARGGPVWRGPWHFGEIRVLRARSGLIVGHDGHRNLARRAARLIDQSTAEVTEVWGPDWSRRVAVLVPDSRAELRSMVGPRFAVDGIAAVAVADRVDTASRRVERPRVVLNPDTASGMSDPALRMVLRHEITHIAARADTDDAAPMWMLEGFADYVGYRGSSLPPVRIAPELARQVRTQGPPTTLPSDRDFQRTGRQLDLAYQQSWSLLDFLARKYGEPRVVELYRRIAGSGAPRDTETALREVTGMSSARLVDEWGADLHRTLA